MKKSFVTPLIIIILFGIGLAGAYVVVFRADDAPADSPEAAESGQLTVLEERSEPDAGADAAASDDHDHAHATDADHDHADDHEHAAEGDEHDHAHAGDAHEIIAAADGALCPEHHVPGSICPFCKPDLVETLGWCGGHDVPEALCTRCHPVLIAAFKAEDDWCSDHGLPMSQCTTCGDGAQEDDG